jgi:hypothetical protein
MSSINQVDNIYNPWYGFHGPEKNVIIDLIYNRWIDVNSFFINKYWKPYLYYKCLKNTINHMYIQPVTWKEYHSILKYKNHDFYGTYFRYINSNVNEKIKPILKEYALTYLSKSKLINNYVIERLYRSPDGLRLQQLKNNFDSLK